MAVIIRGDRIRRVTASMAWTFTSPIVGVLVSLTAVRIGGDAAWGEFVAVMIVVQLIAQVVDWGSRDAVLRDISRDPSALRARWQSNLLSRLVLLLPIGLAVNAAIVIVSTRAPGSLVFWSSIWIAALVVTRAHESLITFYRLFLFGLAVEAVATVVTVGGVLVLGPFRSLDSLVQLFAIVACFRVVLYASIQSFAGLRSHARFRRDELRRSWPFFALTMSGTLGSRVDLYVVTLILAPAIVGQYQVLTGFVLLTQAASAALLAPFLPSIYRLPRSAIRVAAARLIVAGLAITPVAIVVTWLVLERLYQIQLPVAVLIAAWLATLPVFAYLPFVYGLYRDGRERRILVANLIGIAVGLVGTVVLAATFGMLGAMVAAGAAQYTVAAVVIGSARVDEGRPHEAAAALPAT